MIIEDNTLDKKFSELETGDCFIYYSNYYMKIYITYYDKYSDDMVTNFKYAVNLRTGFAEIIKDDTKVRVLNCKMIVE